MTVKKQRIKGGLLQWSDRIANNFLHIQPDPTEIPYALRFSHRHPMGAVVDSKKTQFDSFYNLQQVVPRPKPSVSKAFAEQRSKWSNSPIAKVLKWIICGLVGLGIIGLILILCYFHIGQKRRAWNQE
ncbi:hypothetical protein K469DRAFT_721464 [Zopfia rhizophila CBS 207.26]|uniref:Uncharacterized protein n=1 Tax=Zopfia rhizophila CBS 207.26 TaxID=1314779 RepID=A0A6A6EGZ3_9PEZI|nr:hypothetical protein K469DRAFT_721464 [Zopfia rhizophila CBS 207.26]